VRQRLHSEFRAHSLCLVLNKPHAVLLGLHVCLAAAAAAAKISGWRIERNTNVTITEQDILYQDALL
jgi:hypothetical protein